MPLGLTSLHWRAAIADDCDILVYWYGRKYSISQWGPRGTQKSRAEGHGEVSMFMKQESGPWSGPRLPLVYMVLLCEAQRNLQETEPMPGSWFGQQSRGWISAPPSAGPCLHCHMQQLKGVMSLCSATCGQIVRTFCWRGIWWVRIPHLTLWGVTSCPKCTCQCWVDWHCCSCYCSSRFISFVISKALGALLTCCANTRWTSSPFSPLRSSC